MLKSSQFCLLRLFSVRVLYPICWTLPQTNTESIECTTLFHLSQMFILWINSFASNVGGCICSKCNASPPRFLKPYMLYISFQHSGLTTKRSADRPSHRFSFYTSRFPSLQRLETCSQISSDWFHLWYFSC